MWKTTCPRIFGERKLVLKSFKKKKRIKSWVDREVGVGLGRVGRRGKCDQKHTE